MADFSSGTGSGGGGDGTGTEEVEAGQFEKIELSARDFALRAKDTGATLEILAHREHYFEFTTLDAGESVEIGAGNVNEGDEFRLQNYLMNNALDDENSDVAIQVLDHNDQVLFSAAADSNMLESRDPAFIGEMEDTFGIWIIRLKNTGDEPTDDMGVSAWATWIIDRDDENPLLGEEQDYE